MKVGAQLWLGRTAWKLSECPGASLFDRKAELDFLGGLIARVGPLLRFALPAAK